MRSLPLLLGLTLIAPAAAHAQRPEPDRPRGERREVILPDSDRSRDDGPSYRYRYGQDDDDAEIRDYRQWSPRFRCSYDDWGCGRRQAAMEREEARWRREAREREAEFERNMAERERKFRAKELERWRKHRREMAEHWGDRSRW